MKRAILIAVLLIAGCGRSDPYSVSPGLTSRELEFAEKISELHEKRVKLNDEILQLSKKQIPDPPELNVTFTDEHKGVVQDWITNVNQVRVEFIGKPRLYQFHMDGSIGWIVRCNLSSFDNTTPICSTSNVKRDSSGWVTGSDERRLCWHVKAAGDWRFVHSESRGGSWCDVGTMQNNKDRQNIRLHISPDYYGLNQRFKTTDGYEFREPSVTTDLEVDLYFHNGPVK